MLGDVADVSECQRIIRMVEEGDGLDVLVNTAGVWKDGPSDTMTEEIWDEVMDINVKGTFFMCRYAIPLLEASEGVIVNVSSDSGLVGNKDAAIYCASKGAVTLMTKALAVELAERGIRVNAVCPGDVETPMLDKAFFNHSSMTGRLTKHPCWPKIPRVKVHGSPSRKRWLRPLRSWHLIK